MNILLLSRGLGCEGHFGGIESQSNILASVLSRKGHTVIVGGYNDGSIEVAGGISLRSKKIRIANSIDIRAILEIAALATKEKIHIIIANTGKEYWPAAIAAGIAGARIIFVRHQTDRLKITSCWLINRFISKVIAVSDCVKNALIESGVDPKRIAVIYNSILLDMFRPDELLRKNARKEFGLRDDNIVVGMAGKLYKTKGVFDLLHAIGHLKLKYPTIRLIFVGDGTRRRELELEAKRLSVEDKVVFTGKRNDMRRMYAAMDIFTLPSTCDEAFGMVLIEAMAMGKPVVATTVGGIPEIIENEVNGLLIPPGGVTALANAISRYVDDRELARKLAAEGRKIVESKFSTINMDHFERILISVAR
jgi:glycosyltransferase involved in cell wall biosynthesis